MSIGGLSRAMIPLAKTITRGLTPAGLLYNLDVVRSRSEQSLVCSPREFKCVGLHQAVTALG